MPTLLHVSDLHRTAGPRLHNDDLLAAIASDAVRWDAEGIARPELIVVSGDLVQGAGPDAADPEAEITAQYVEADDFLRRLAAEFVGGDRSRVVLVPGNHDVSWSRARHAMAAASACPDGIARLALEPDSGVRWDWATQQAFEVVDDHLYESRLEQFRNFRADFYAGLDAHPLAHGEDILFFDYPELGLAFVGFASWHGNDCFCDVGEIDSRVVALSRQLLAASQAPVAVAVWHHSLVGGPRARDYMDQRVIHRLIDFGFSIGLHGHQHYPGAAPYELRLPNLTSMVVIGAGSLAVGDRELPMGERRQFNLVVIDPPSETVTVHVRGMSSEGVFTGTHRDDWGGNTSISLAVTPSPARPAAASAIRRLDDAMIAVAAGDYEDALGLIEGVGPSHLLKKRQVQIEALTRLNRTDELLALLDPPQTVDELIKVVSLLLDVGRHDDAEHRLNTSRHLLDGGLADELASTINARRMVP